MWSAERHGTGVDGSGLSAPVRLGLEFTLPAPVANTELWDWYEQQLRSQGWERARGGSILNAGVFDRMVGDRQHTLLVEAWPGPGAGRSDYAVDHTIGSAKD
ncbi:MAG: hypothetical protein ACRD12_14710 [Acidimicrobiales bacterium]